MTYLLNKFILGIPKGQPRPRARAWRTFSQKKGCMVNTARIYKPGVQPVDDWKKAIVDGCSEFKPAQPWTGPFSINLRFLMPRPKAKCRKCDPAGLIPCMAAPDVDNLEKAVFDCLVQAEFITDDAPIVASMTEKFYHAKGGASGVELKLYQWSDRWSEGLNGDEKNEH